MAVEGVHGERVAALAFDRDHVLRGSGEAVLGPEERLHLAARRAHYVERVHQARGHARRVREQADAAPSHHASHDLVAHREPIEAGEDRAHAPSLGEPGSAARW